MTRIVLPTLHADQVRAYVLPGKRRVVRCGRRWGKTDLGKTIACDGVIRGQEIGWFAPQNKFQRQAYHEIAETLKPIIKSASKTDWVMHSRTGGRIDFWSLENEAAGRSRRYHKVIIDEGAFAGANMLDIWEQSIEPTLLDFEGECWVLSNTNGNDPENFLYQICKNPKHGFVEYRAPSYRNPYIPQRRPGESDVDLAVRRAERFRRLKATKHPLVWRQEYLAKFVDWSGTAFFDKQKLLVDGLPLAELRRCDFVFAVMDTAVKTGKDNDGTGVTYFARNHNVGHPVVIIDWEIAQIAGDLLATYVPTVIENLEALARKYNARQGSAGLWIEDASTGQVLLMAGERQGWNVHAIDGALTAKGKDERAISVSGYVYRGEVKILAEAYDKVTVYKDTSRNHLMSQVLGFRIGDKDTKRADDLLDTFTYGISIALGDEEGI